jgi:hypothetical protein
MRIQSGQPISTYAQRTSNGASPELFESTLLKAENKEEKPEEKKGRLVTTREGAYIRQYIVGSDGSKILLSEIKQSEDELTATENYKPTASPSQNRNESGMSENTKEALNLLNVQMGASVPFNPTKQRLSANE